MPQAPWDEVLEELRAIRGRLDQIAARVVSERDAEALLPVWTCGHRHRNRGEALKCAMQPMSLVGQ